MAAFSPACMFLLSRRRISPYTRVSFTALACVLHCLYRNLGGGFFWNTTISEKSVEICILNGNLARSLVADLAKIRYFRQCFFTFMPKFLKRRRSPAARQLLALEVLDGLKV